MARQKKITSVSSGRLGRNADIFVDEDGWFTAQVGDQHFKEEKLSDIKELVFEALKRTGDLEWKKVIVVCVEEDDGDRSIGHRSGATHFEELRSHLQMGFFRIELAKKGSETFCRPFLREDNLVDGQKAYQKMRKNDYHREQAVKTNLRDRETGQDVSEFREEGSIIPYTEETWATLLQLRVKISDMSFQLKAMLNQENAERVLAQASSNLLLLSAGDAKPAAPPKPPPKKRFLKIGR